MNRKRRRMRKRNRKRKRRKKRVYIICVRITSHILMKAYFIYFTILFKE